MSEAYGAEFELFWRATPPFLINASVGYLHFEFTSFSAAEPLDPRLFAPGAVGSALVKDFAGNATRMAPKWSQNVSPSYGVQLGNGGSIEQASNFPYRSKQFHTEFNDDRLSQDAYIQLDANILRTNPNGRSAINFWAKNITDELVYGGNFSVSTSRAIGGTLMPPRTYGLTVGVKY